MKKNTLVFILLISTILSSCSKEYNKATIIATSEGCTRNKTFLNRQIDENDNEYFEIKWEVGDPLLSFGVNADGGPSGHVYCVDRVSTDGRTAYIDDVNSTYDCDLIGYFSYNCGGDFPITTESGWTDEHLDFRADPILDVSSVQFYDETRVVGGFPMIAKPEVYEYSEYSSSTHLFFYNICGILRIKIKDGHNNMTRVKKIKLTSSCPMSGYHSCSFDFDRLCTHGDYYDANNYVTLSCFDANQGTGVPLANEGTDFYFYIIPTLMNDMIIEVTNMNDEVATKNLSGHVIQVMRSQLTGIKVDFTNIPFI